MCPKRSSEGVHVIISEDSKERKRSVWQEAAMEFLGKYESDIANYRRLTGEVSDLCKRLFDPIKTFPTQISARTKTYESLAKKVQKLAIKFWKQDQGFTSKKEAFDKLHSAISDRAGVRILVYFPDDVLKVAEVIESSGHFVVEATKLSTTKSRTIHDRNNLQPEDYLIGDWYSAPDGKIGQYWRHSGYRAGHLRVRMNNKAVKWVEIQVTTIVMHAWAQVEHDIIYKKRAEFIPTGAMNRMLDAVNGLSITSEIMLEELAKNLERADEEGGKKDVENFQSSQEFADWFKQTYPETGLMGHKYHRWRDTPDWVDTLFSACKLLECGYSRSIFKDLIEDGKFLERSPRKSEKLDISVLLLTAMSIKYNWIEDEGLKNSSHAKEYLRLSKLTLVASAFSFMVVLRDTEAIEMLKEKFPHDIDNMRRINSIVSLFNIHTGEMEKLEGFADRFLKTNWCETHDLAVALAKLGFFLTDTKLGEFKNHYDSQSALGLISNLKLIKLGQVIKNQDSTIFDHIFQEQYGDVQSVVFDTGLFQEHTRLWRGQIGDKSIYKKDIFNKKLDFGPKQYNESSGVYRILQRQSPQKENAVMFLGERCKSNTSPIPPPRLQTTRYLDRNTRIGFILYTTSYMNTGSDVPKTNKAVVSTTPSRKSLPHRPHARRRA
ncbi:uncharacterized protein GGS22DRAFT_195581 [Annulohypoxylon maeteangense]|uniref:uncharacterized protein n=1 Tax=Annulohypoxylon maeteangense TaxID=1927788 RepID=UPI002007D6E2|nr:uncharacterized protein GGS22DRAFT_195581 [Annulohypoxylon maeteangense]KAI0882854.1 hypothetical protein GGS22DRAFT_195581 [Annulohypoxylon maeteangense]